MHPLKTSARIAGAAYLSMVITGPFSLLYVPGKLIVRGNATATAANILAHETMFRFGIVAGLFGQVLFIWLGVALYRLLSDVSKTWARMMFGFILVAAGVEFVNELNNLGAGILFRGGEFLTVFDKAQLDALGMLFIRLHGKGNMIAEVFWGLWLFPFGLLVYHSGFLPRWIGVWLMINCFGYLILFVTALFFPDYNDKAFLYLQPVFVGELAIMLYMLIWGAKVARVPAVISVSGSQVQAPQL